jgi:hypothetical protein
VSSVIVNLRKRQRRPCDKPPLIDVPGIESGTALVTDSANFVISRRFRGRYYRTNRFDIRWLIRQKNLALVWTSRCVYGV